MDVVLLSRIQFGMTTAFHLVVPILTIGIALFLVVVEWLWLSTQNALYYRMYRFWVRIFAVHYGPDFTSPIPHLQITSGFLLPTDAREFNKEKRGGGMNLIHVWVFLVGLVAILYVLLDGFILGIGLLFFSAEDETELDVLIGTIAPVWDANQMQSAIFPFAILPGVSVYEAASQNETLSFALSGVALILPVVLG